MSPDAEDTTDELLTITALSTELRVPVKTLRDWRLKGEGPKGFLLGGKIRYRRSVVDAWIAGREGGMLPKAEEQPTVSLEDACKALGISWVLGQELASRDAFPVPVLPIGGFYRVPTAPLRRVLHLDEPGPAEAVGGARRAS